MQRPWLNTAARKAESRYPDEYPVRDPRYNCARWHKESAAYRTAHPLCAECARQGKITPTEVVDHIKPAPLCSDAEFWDKKNWQPLCQKCNHAKGQRDKKLIAAAKQVETR